MTVALAAICGVGIPNMPPLIIAASDRMISIGDIGFEPQQTKSLMLATQTVGLFAGAMHVHADVAPRVMEWANKQPPGILVRDLAQQYADRFAEYRRLHAERRILHPLGLDLADFGPSSQNMSPGLAEGLRRELSEYPSGAEALIAGVDQTGAHIFGIYDPGIAYSYNTEAFAVIGIGGELVRSHFMFSRYDKRWHFNNSLFLTFSAKVRAEMAAGVGTETDLIIIRAGGHIQARPQEIAHLRELLKNHSQKISDADNDAHEAIRRYISELATAEQQQAQSPNQSAATEQLRSDPTSARVVPKPEAV